MSGIHLLGQSLCLVMARILRGPWQTGRMSLGIQQEGFLAAQSRICQCSSIPAHLMSLPETRLTTGVIQNT
jgi:hypothetical protein